MVIASGSALHTTEPFTLPEAPFTKSIRVDIEHRGEGTDASGKPAGFLVRPDYVASVAYWYQTEPHAAFPPLPSVNDRLIEEVVSDLILYQSSASRRKCPLLTPPVPGAGRKTRPVKISAAPGTIVYLRKEESKLNTNTMQLLRRQRARFSQQAQGRACPHTVRRDL
jgi:hypothetical protein